MARDAHAVIFLSLRMTLVVERDVGYTGDMVKKSPHAKMKSPATHRVDYYPNRMGLVVATIAAVSLVILGIIAVTN